MAKNNKNKRKEAKVDKIRQKKNSVQYDPNNKKEKQWALNQQKKALARGDKEAIKLKLRNQMEDKFVKAYLNTKSRTNKEGEIIKGGVAGDETARGYISRNGLMIDYMVDAFGITELSGITSAKTKTYIMHLAGGLYENHEEKLADAIDEAGGESINVLSEKEYSVSTIGNSISAIAKFREVLEVEHFERTGEQKSVRIINNEDCREFLKENDLYRDIENMQKSTKITQEQYEQIIEQLSPQAAAVFRFERETGSRVTASLGTLKEDVYEDRVFVRRGKGGKRYDVDEINPEYLHELNETYKDYADDRRIFDQLYVDADGNELKKETEINYIQNEIKQAARNIGLENVSTHSARALYCQTIYDKYLAMNEADVDAVIMSRFDKYEEAFRKELERINEKRKFNRKNFATHELKDFKNVLASYTQEEKAALIASIESGHERISIMIYYIERTVARKTKGSNK